LGLAAKGGTTLFIVIYMQIQTHTYRERSIFLYTRVFFIKFFISQGQQNVREPRLGLATKGGATRFILIYMQIQTHI